jgi:hypothetical protein
VPGRDEWARRFEQQSVACAELGSVLYGRLLRLLAEEIRAATATWDVLASHQELRFGQAAPLRLLGTAHRLALGGDASEWAEVLPSCGGVPPESDEALLVAWRVLVDLHADRLVDGLSREVQTNEVARAAGLGLALAETGFPACDLVELGCSGGLNLRLDHFDLELGGLALGRADGPVQLRPELRGHLGALRHEGLVMPQIGNRTGIDPHPVDPTTPEGRLTLLSYVWPDQEERLARVEAAIGLARAVPAEIVALGAGGPPDTASALEAVIGAPVPTVVQQSIMWQYVAPEQRWRITEVMEERGAQATDESPLGWVRYEPDEWDRRRAAVWLRRWPGGSDRLVAHVDYHGRWLSPAS